MRSSRFHYLAFAVLAAGSGCSSPGDGQAPDAGPRCMLSAPDACQMPVPSWSKDIQPIVNQACSPCHFPGGQALLKVPYDYTTYAGFRRAGTTVESQLLSCAMPQEGGDAPLTTAEGDTILNWIVCGEPDN